MKPEFVDNRGDNTLVKALKGHLNWIKHTYQNPVDLAIATGYFNPSGFGMVADDLEDLSRTRLLLGAEPLPPPLEPPRRPGDPRGERYDAYAVAKALQEHSNGLVRDCNLLGFSREIDKSIRRLLDLLGSGKIEVRRYEKRFLHGKAYIFADDEGVIAGSSNFTAAGLTTNLELNLGRYEPHTVTQVKDWFEDLWNDSEPFDLASIYAARYQEFDPYLIYLHVLWERYGEEVATETAETGYTLTTFQKDGLFRARRILDEYNGVIFADGVGLGKTFIGADLVREVLDEKRQRALLIAPAALRDGTWKRFCAKHQLYMERISYEQLAGDSQLGGNKKSCLAEDPKRYSLVVVDEAQAFRNPATERARALRKLLEGKPPKKLVLLSATPVNNSLWDLYYLLTYFIGHDARFADRGIVSLNERFKEAMAVDPYSLRPDLLFDILDATCVRRTRHFVQKYYPDDKVMGPNGVMIPIRFPKPHVKAVKYDLDSAMPGFFAEFAEKLAPDDDAPALTLARYAPTRYLKNKKLDMNEKVVLARELALVGLIRTMLLKRLESSPHAFAETLSRMAENHNAFLGALKKGYIPKPKVLDEWSELDSDEVLEELLKTEGSEGTGAYNVRSLKADVANDLRILDEFGKRARSVRRKSDPKLARLKATLLDILRSSENEGRTPEETRSKRKVIVFSYFEDTLDWIEEWLRELVQTDRALATYRGRIVSVGGGDSRGEVTRESAIFGFAPVSSEAPPGREDDRFDILLTTDVLAEGQNLQQCRNIVNYDLPWNPMRLVQRHGRIDRIGSPHKEVFIWCFLPDRELDDLLGLEERIRKKLAQAAASIGVESEVIPQGATSDIVFAGTKMEIESIRKEQSAIFENAGEDPSAHSGEEYRQELRKGLLKRGDEIRNLPWAAGSGFRGDGRRGYFFCARIGDRVFMRFIDESKTKTVRDTLECLKTINCKGDTRREIDNSLLKGIYDAWSSARHDVFSEWSEATDPKKLQPKVRPLFKQVAVHLRRYPPEGATQEELDATIDAIEAPWGIRIERQIRTVFEESESKPGVTSKRVFEKVRELGLQPFKAPQPLPPIDEEDIALVCWMIVS